ncbi:phage tail sheath subtilisin-like domain-containing protein [Desulfosarcina sp. OttesenSCG-928-G10]|nr:phage tail sheath subtilisin-like domain-containing protein [Desulfosarcina sp. OttesenSCG-928-G10]
MANNYLTPGVYVQEISTLPGVVVEVQSAIPAFIGYTQKDRYDGRILTGVPEHIASFKDFEARFGGASRPDFKAINIRRDAAGRFSAVDSIQLNKRFLMYEAIYMYFANGGGECYVVSTGTYLESYDKEAFLSAISALESVDDVTLIVMPEISLLGESCYGVQQAALAHCAKRMNRFSILDIQEKTKESGKEGAARGSALLNWKPGQDPDSWKASWQEFRDRVGIMDLSYGASYTPYLVADTPIDLKYYHIQPYLQDAEGKASNEAGAEVRTILIEGQKVSVEGKEEKDNAAKVTVDECELTLTADNITLRGKEVLMGSNTNLNTGGNSAEIIISEDKIKIGAEDEQDLGQTVTIDGMTFTKEKKGISLKGKDISIDGPPISDPEPTVAPLSLLDLDPAAKSSIESLDIALNDRENLRRAVAEARQALISKGVATDRFLLGIVKNVLKDVTKDDPKLLVAEAYARLFAAIMDIKQEDLKTNGVALKESFNPHPMSKDMIQYTSDQLKSNIAKITEPEFVKTTGSPGESTNLAQALYDALLQVKDEKFQDAVDLLQALIDGLFAATTKNINRLSDGLYSNSLVYRSIHSAVSTALRVQPPSATMAGIYAAVDRSRGVWKAPANVSVGNVLNLTQTITAEMQEKLNSDSVAGKSINAIRSFPGQGFLVWGARTLDGNSLEWRYIPVRRFFIMVEESIRRATTWAVFEPNDANLWVKVKALIDNYLLQKWKDGALAGASPAEAYFVNVGLGSTMTEQDILEGRLIVDIGMAVVRPAEFIILRFMHKMQQS